MQRHAVRRRGRRGAMLLLAAAAGVAHPAAAGACTLAMYSGSLSGGVFLATALPDTAAAGAPPDQRALQRLESASGRRSHGQVMRVSRVAGAGAAVLRERMGTGGAEVVFVPWGYDESCRPVPWRWSARWARPGLRGVVLGHLRAPRFWVEGRPTVDVYGFGMYSDTAGRREDPDALSAAEYFELQSRLPTVDEARHAPEAYRALFDWVRANPRQALRYPAPSVIGEALGGLRYARARRAETPLGGTWRLTVSLPGRPDATLFLRTLPHPGPWDTAAAPYRPPVPRTVEDLLPRPLLGYSFTADAAPTLAGLPRSAREAGWHAASVSLEAVERPAVDARGERVWRGRIGLFHGQGTWFPDAETRRIWRAHEGPVGHASMPAVFRQRRDGRVTVEQTLEADGRVISVIRGEKLSDERTPWKEATLY